MKKILVVYGGAKNRGGIHSYLLNLFEGLKNDEKISLTLYSIGQWPLSRELTEMGVEVVVSSKKTTSPLTWFEIAQLAKQKGFDLLVGQGMVANLHVRIATLLTKIPNLIIVHSDWRTDYQGVKKIIFFVTDRLTRFATSQYVAVSKYLKEQLVAEGVCDEEIKVIYNGTAGPGTITGKKSANTITIGSVGRLHPVKNYQNLIKSFNGLDENIKLEIAGEGAERAQLEKIIAAEGLAERVTLLGQQKNLAKVFSGWDAYIQPSLTEGFGLATVEAMLSGLPVIVSPGGALPEIVSQGKAGYIMDGFEPEDIRAAIRKLAKDSKLKKELTQRGQAFAQEHFSKEKWLQNIRKELLEATK